MSFLGLPRRKEPCGRCGWRYEGFHVCFDASKPCPGEGVISPAPRKERQRTSDKNNMTEAGRAKIVQVTSERWERYHEENQERDAQIVEFYKDNHSLKEVARKFDLSHSTVLKVLRMQEGARGETIIRPRGANLKPREKEVSGGFI